MDKNYNIDKKEFEKLKKHFRTLPPEYLLIMKRAIEEVLGYE